MFKSYVDSIIGCINNLSIYLSRSDEDKEKRENGYLEKTEEMLNLVIKVLITYFPTENSFSIPFENQSIKINFLDDCHQWMWEFPNSQNRLTTKEAANRFWKCNMNINSFLMQVFNRIKNHLNRKLNAFQKIEQENEQRLTVIRQGNKALESLLDKNLLNKLKLAEQDNSE